MAGMIHLAKEEWIAALPFFAILFVAMICDTLMGLLIAFSRKELSSSASWKGITRKIGVLILIVFASVLDPLVPLQLTTTACIGYIIPEGLSLMENGTKLGIVKNPALVAALSRLRQSTEASETTRVKLVQPMEVISADHTENTDGS
jgi:toxin secretion/phage lysis holin